MRAAPRDRGRGPSRIVFPGGCFGRTRPGGMEEMVVPLDDVNDIRAMDAAGVPRAEIARRLGLSRNTVAKYADMADMSPAAPEARVRRRRALSREDAAWVDAVLEADLGAPRKQRHSARRIYDRRGVAQPLRRGRRGRGRARHGQHAARAAARLPLEVQGRLDPAPAEVPVVVCSAGRSRPDGRTPRGRRCFAPTWRTARTS